MNRIIKFRCWDSKTKKMYKVCLMNTYKEYGEGENVSFNLQAQTIWVAGKNTPILHASDAELMQFTGLKDKNGKEIYEGDIVTYTATGNEVNTFTTDFIMKVVFEKGMFKAKGNVLRKEKIISKDWKNLGERKWEVIGNIWENPELLK